jgi:hypothetical protein
VRFFWSRKRIRPKAAEQEVNPVNALAEAAILKAWEQSQALPEQEAALALLGLARKETTRDLARLPLGERNARLLELRAATLGRRMDVFAVCPYCSQPLEFAVDALALAEGLRVAPPRLEALESCSMRPVNTLDLLAAREAANEEQAQAILLARTLEWHQRHAVEGLPVAAEAAASDNLAWLESQSPSRLAEWKAWFEALNAAAEIRFQLMCVACAQGWQMNLDIGKFLLREIALAARKLMSEVHELASAYGWSERAILAMSGPRRAAYLQRIGA